MRPQRLLPSVPFCAPWKPPPQGDTFTALRAARVAEELHCLRIFEYQRCLLTISQPRTQPLDAARRAGQPPPAPCPRAAGREAIFAQTSMSTDHTASTTGKPFRRCWVHSSTRIPRGEQHKPSPSRTISSAGGWRAQQPAELGFIPQLSEGGKGQLLVFQPLSVRACDFSAVFVWSTLQEVIEKMIRGAVILPVSPARLAPELQFIYRH